MGSGRGRDDGFTLVEVLVVAIILGILAAIAIPMFLNQREKAWDAAAKADLRNAAIHQEAYASEFGTYVDSGCSTSVNDCFSLRDQGFQGSSEVTLEVVIATQTQFCMQARHNSSARSWFIATFLGDPIGEPTLGTCV